LSELETRQLAGEVLAGHGKLPSGFDDVAGKETKDGALCAKFLCDEMARFHTCQWCECSTDSMLRSRECGVKWPQHKPVEWNWSWVIAWFFTNPI